jgi:hypothetical protein
VWTLLPSDLKNFDLSRDARRDLMESYVHKDFGKIAPALGVAAGGALISVAYRYWSAQDARTKAEDNLKTGKVTFEPRIFDRGLGFGMRW